MLFPTGTSDDDGELGDGVGVGVATTFCAKGLQIPFGRIRAHVGVGTESNNGDGDGLGVAAGAGVAAAVCCGSCPPLLTTLGTGAAGGVIVGEPIGRPEEAWGVAPEPADRPPIPVSTLRTGVRGVR